MLNYSFDPKGRPRPLGSIYLTFYKMQTKTNPLGSRIIIITGGSGSGKTILANAIKRDIFQNDTEVISHDMYYIDKDNFDPDYRVDYDAPESLDNDLLASHLKKLKNGQAIDAPIYDFQTKDRLEKTFLIEPKKVIIVEGILTLAIPRLRELADLSIFIDVDDDIRLARRVIRDFVHGGRSQLSDGGLEDEFKYYFKYVKPNYKKYIAPLDEVADIVVRNNADTPDPMIERVENILKKFKLK
jgi:uridine kinase